MWTYILRIDGTLHYFRSKLLWHVLAFQHCSNHVKYGSIFPLNYSILLGWVWCYKKSPYSLQLNLLHEFEWDELAYSVKPNKFDRHVNLLFNHCFEPFKHLEHLGFLLQKIHSCFLEKSSMKEMKYLFPLGMATGRGRVSLSHTHPRKKNSSSSPYPNPTGIKLLFHPHPHWVTGIILYPYPYSFYYYFNINFN